MGTVGPRDVYRDEDFPVTDINEERQQQVNRIAAELGCSLVQKPALAGMMYVEYEPPMIEGPVIKTQQDYLVMLHELGHVKLGHTQGRPPYENKKFYFENGVLHSEAQAWEYALDQSREEITQDSRVFMWDRCLGSYYRGAKEEQGRNDCQLWNGNRHHVRFTWDVPDGYFWSIYSWITKNAFFSKKLKGPWYV